MKFLPLNNSNLLATVDDEIFGVCNKEIWSLFGKKKKQIRNTHGKQLPNFIKNDSKMWDHKDRNFLNNQNDNLRECNYQQNMANTDKFSNRVYSSKFKGVSYCKRDSCWRAYIKLKGRTFALGTFKTETTAAKIYNEAAMRHFGEFAVLNDVESVVVSIS